MRKAPLVTVRGETRRTMRMMQHSDPIRRIIRPFSYSENVCPNGWIVNHGRNLVLV